MAPRVGVCTGLKGIGIRFRGNSTWIRLFDGANDFGFDENTILPASLDFPPMSTFIIRESHPNRCGDNPQPFPAFLREGPIGADFKMEAVLDHLMDQAIGFLENRPSERPHFLLCRPDIPPQTGFTAFEIPGSCALGPCMILWFKPMMQWRLLQALDDQGLSQETVVLFTSDNGSFMRVTDEDHVEDSTIQGYRPEHHQANGPHAAPRRIFGRLAIESAF